MTDTFDDIDLCDLDRFQRGEHHEMLSRLRNVGNGTHWLTDEDGEGFWAVTRMEPFRDVVRQSLLFSSHVAGTQIKTPAPDDETSQLMRNSLMVYMDPPDHTRYRTLVAGGFTPKMVKLLETYVSNRAAMVVDGVCEQGACDFVTDLAAELPVQAIGDMMGVPEEDRPNIIRWANTVVGNSDPEFATSMDDVEAAFAEMYAYSHALQSERRQNPRDDILTALLQAEVDGERLTEEEFDMFFLLLCLAGSETTRNTLSYGIHAFIENRDQWEKLLVDPDATIDGAVEEVLRWASPVLHVRRTATADYDLFGTPVKAGDKVVIWHVSANRDESVFYEPFRFDIDRSPNDHVTFGGGGPHYCLGASLARSEMRVMLREIAARLPDIRATGEPQYLRSNFLRGMKHLPVEFTPSASKNTEAMPYLGYTTHTRARAGAGPG